MDTPNLKALSDEDLIGRLETVVAKTNRLTVQLLLLLNELEERRLHSEDEYPSLVDFCVQRLGMSESAAHRRVTAARLVREFPQLLAALARGEIHLSLLVSLRRHVTKENCDDLVAATRGRPRDEVDEILARRAPRPDEPARMRKVPEARTANEMTPVAKPAVEPAAESRYRLSITISRERRDQIERLLDRMTDSNPKRDLTVLFERAIDALEGKRERETIARTTPLDASSDRPAKESPGESKTARRRRLPPDGERRSFVTKIGQDRPAGESLEIGHGIPRAEAGAEDARTERGQRRAQSTPRGPKPSGKERGLPGIRQGARSGPRPRARAAAA